MGILDDVVCNNDLFGEHKGETHFTQSLHPVFPGSTYEITPTGRLELLECNYEDRSDPKASRWLRFVGMMTPVFTGQRSDVALHGWLEFPGFGRARFNAGTLVSFEQELDKSLDRICLRTPESKTVRYQLWKARSSRQAAGLRSICVASFPNSKG